MAVSFETVADFSVSCTVKFSTSASGAQFAQLSYNPA